MVVHIDLHLYLNRVSTRLDHSVDYATVSIVHSPTENCSKKRENPINYIAQIAERGRAAFVSHAVLLVGHGNLGQRS